MQRVRVVHWLRFSAGLGLILLLVAAQEKLCPRGAPPVPDADPPPRSGDEGAAPKPRKAPLPQIVPDVAAHRFAVPGAAAELQAGRGSRDGAVSRGPDRAGPAGSDQVAVECPSPWPSRVPRVPPTAGPIPEPGPVGALPLLTAIFPQGPPAGFRTLAGRRVA